MAATRLIAMHINKGKTVAQCLADRTDYSQNEKKTEDGKYISAYACDPRTCDEEFLTIQEVLSEIVSVVSLSLQRGRQSFQAKMAA